MDTEWAYHSKFYFGVLFELVSQLGWIHANRLLPLYVVVGPRTPGMVVRLRGGCTRISGSSAAFFGSSRDHPFPLPPPSLSSSLPSLSALPPPVFSNQGPAWQTWTRPFRRPFASSPFFSLFSSSALPLLLINLLLLFAGIHPHPAPGTLPVQILRHWTRSPQTVPPDEPAPVAALASSVPSQFYSFPIGLQSVCSPSAFSPSYASCKFFFFFFFTAPFWPSPPHPMQQSFNLSPLTFSPSGPIFPSPPPMSPASFTFSPFAFIPAAPVRPSSPSLPQNSFSPSPTVIRRPGPPAPSPLLELPLAACSQPALPAAGPALAPRSPSSLDGPICSI